MRFRVRRHRFVHLSAVVTSALLVAACGSSGKSATSTTTPASNGSATSAPPAGSPYVIGNMVTATSSFSAIAPAVTATPKAWASWTNDHGGINGHPVQLIQMDDLGDSGKALADVQQLVSSNHVIALVADDDVTTEAGFETLVTQANVPVIGPIYSDISETNPDFFPTAATNTVNGYGRVTAAKLGGITKLGQIYCTEAAACLQDVQTQQAAAPQVGIKVVATVAASLTAPNYTAQCLKLKDAGANGVYFSSNPPPIADAAIDCARQGMKLVHVLGEPDPVFLKTPELYQNGLVGEDVELPFYADVTATQDYRAAMMKYAPGVTLQADSIYEWSALEVFKKALEMVPNESASPQTVKDGLYALPAGYDANGLTPPLHYVSGQPTTVKCFFIWGVTKTGTFYLPQGTKTSCQP